LKLIHYYLILIGYISYYIPFIIVLLNLKKYNNHSIFARLLYFFVSYNFISIIIEQFILDDSIDNFNPIYNIVTIIDFCTIIAIFSKILHGVGRKYFNYTILVYLLVSISELLFVNDLFSINLFSNNLSKSLIIIIAGITIYFSEIKIEITSSQKIFTYTLFMYSILTLPIALFEQFIRLETSDYLHIIWSLNILFALFYNLFLSLSLWKLKK
jgi:hypothetical protein